MSVEEEADGSAVHNLTARAEGDPDLPFYHIDLGVFEPGTWSEAEMIRRADESYARYGLAPDIPADIPSPASPTPIGTPRP